MNVAVKSVKHTWKGQFINVINDEAMATGK